MSFFGRRNTLHRTSRAYRAIRFRHGLHTIDLRKRVRRVWHLANRADCEPVAAVDHDIRHIVSARLLHRDLLAESRRFRPTAITQGIQSRRLQK